MEHKHLDAAALECLIAIDRTVEQNELLFHLLAVCPGCREAGGWLLDLHQADALPSMFGPVDATLARSRAEAPRLLEELALLAPDERLTRVETDPRFVSWGLCEFLVRRSCQTTPEQATEAVQLANLAVLVAELIPEDGPFEEQWVYQLRSLAWAGFGNARRVGCDLSRAEESFERADSWWEEGTTDTEDALGYEPVLLDLKASLRMAQRRFPEARDLLDHAVDLFLDGDPEHRDPRLAGSSLIKKAAVLMEMGETESAIQVLKKANGLIDPAEAAGLLPDIRELAAAVHG